MPTSPKSTKSAISKAAFGVAMMMARDLVRKINWIGWCEWLARGKKTSARPPYRFDDKAQVVVVEVKRLRMTADLDSS
jgi:hypothetical protein